LKDFVNIFRQLQTSLHRNSNKNYECLKIIKNNHKFLKTFSFIILTNHVLHLDCDLLLLNFPSYLLQLHQAKVPSVLGWISELHQNLHFQLKSLQLIHYYYFSLIFSYLLPLLESFSYITSHMKLFKIIIIHEHLLQPLVLTQLLHQADL